jgi:predicted metal-dependent hydrolase
MRKIIKTNNGKIEYSLKKSSRARKIRITVNCDASVVLTLPIRSSEIFAEKFLLEKSTWVLKKINYFKKYKVVSVKRRTRSDYLKNKELARKLIVNKINKVNSFYGFKFNKVSIRNQKTRWGSCSINRNLNFNYKLIYLPEELSEYIVAHEICHLKEFNHSREFWKLVSEGVPSYKEIRKELKRIII